VRAWIVALALATAGAAMAAEAPQRSAAEAMDVLMWNREPVGGPFALVDHHGKRRTDADFRGRLMLVYFGYTFCPDVCPTDLLQIGQLMKTLGPAQQGLQPLFITLDPGRDTSKQLAAYVPHFHPAIIGLTGAPAAIDAAANAYKVYYKKVPGLTGGAYSVDHSAFIYLMDRKGKYLGFFPPGTPADRMLAVIRGHL
jgi:protein SCO2